MFDIKIVTSFLSFLVENILGVKILKIHHRINDINLPKNSTNMGVEVEVCFWTGISYIDAFQDGFKFKISKFL